MDQIQGAFIIAYVKYSTVHDSIRAQTQTEYCLKPEKGTGVIATIILDYYLRHYSLLAGGIFTHAGSSDYT